MNIYICTIPFPFSLSKYFALTYCTVYNPHPRGARSERNVLLIPLSALDASLYIYMHRDIRRCIYNVRVCGMWINIGDKKRVSSVYVCIGLT